MFCINRKKFLRTIFTVILGFSSAVAFATKGERNISMQDNISSVEAIPLNVLRDPVVISGTTGNNLTAEVTATCQKENKQNCYELPKKISAKKVSDRVRRVDSSRASNCSFSVTRSVAELEDEYLQFMYGKNHPQINNVPSVENVTETGASADRREGEYKEFFSDTAPGGTAQAGVALAKDCSQLDINNAAGRNRILRKDKTLTEAFAAYDAQKFPEAMEIFKKSYAKIGYAEAALVLGDMYFLGQGTQPNIQEAISWYTKLAEARYVKEHKSPFNPAQPDKASLRVQAQIKLARIHMMGVSGVPKNLKVARHWYEEASELDYVPAKYRLGQMNENGYGGEKNSKAAIKLYIFAAESGYAPAQFRLAELYYYGDESPQNTKAAFDWYEQAAFNPFPDNNKSEAQYSLAKMYDDGTGVAADPKKAFALYKLAALAGHSDAQYALGVYFYLGEIVEKNWTVARRLFDAAALQQQIDAMFNLSLMMMKGEGGEVDKVKASVWLTLATKLGHSKAPALLAKLETQLTPEQRF